MLTFKCFRVIGELILKMSAIIVYRLACKMLRIAGYQHCSHLMILFCFTSAGKVPEKSKIAGCFDVNRH